MTGNVSAFATRERAGASEWGLDETLGLSALIAASEPADEGGGLRATLLLAGDALIEHQARQVALAGADHIVILAERIPAALAAAVDRMRRNGLRVDIARTSADAADRIHPDARLIVLADGVVADQAVIDRIISAPGAAVVVVPDAAENEIFERIDGQHRWGGVMLCSGDELAETVAMLGEWELVSTLLRRILQGGPARLAALAGDHIFLVRDTASTEAVRERLVAASNAPAGSWVARYIYAWPERLAARALLRRGVPPAVLEAAALLLTIVAAAAFLAAPAWAGLLILVLAGGVASLSARIIRLKLRQPPARDLFDMARWIASGLALLGLTWALSLRAGWGTWALAAALVVAMRGVAAQTMILRLTRGPTAQPSRWIADRDALPLVALPFAAAGLPVIGLAFGAAYAGLSLLWTQQMLLRPQRGE
ncbi:hypothetical protein [Sphingomonas sp. ID0503]|uniref:hypothetical protein n=1 Tax=Sphingomonas sp. ID0503 TaxID=3399691 RepID=UPI003AFB1183